MTGIIFWICVGMILGVCVVCLALFLVFLRMHL